MRITLLYLLLLLGIVTYSQQQYNILYSVPNASSMPITIFETDTGYIISSSSPPTIYLLDFTGNIKWIKQWYFDLPSGIGQIHKTSNNIYIAAGDMQSGGIIEKNFLLKFSNNLDTILSVIYNVDTSMNTTTFLYNCFESSDGKYILCGDTPKDSSGLYFPNNYNKGWLIVCDTLGNLICNKTIGLDNDYDWFNTGLQMGSNYYLFGGTRSYAPAYVTGFDRTDGWVVKTDMQGNEIASANFGNEELADREFTYALTIQNNKILTGNDIGIGTHSSGYRLFKPYILILNNDLSIFKEIYFNNTYVSGDTIFNCHFAQGVLKNDSSILLLGREVYISASGYYNISANAFVLSLTKEFEIEYKRNYIHTGNEFGNLDAYTISPTSDGGYIFGGSVVDNTLSPPQQTWLVKTDSLGCDGFNSCNDTALAIEILNYTDTFCVNDTNWLAVRLKGRSAPYSVYINNQLAKDSIYYPNHLPVWINTFVPFVPQDTGLQQLTVTLHEPWERKAYDTVLVYVKKCVSNIALYNYYNNSIKLYPNPAKEEITVRTEHADIKIKTIELTDINGKTLKSIYSIPTSGEILIDIKNLEKGVYIVKIKTKDNYFVKRFVKQ
ncbi:MAG: hypothetical protein Kow0068_15120 [Marinilabiliales bacterium]